MPSQFRAQGLRILEYMKGHSIEEGWGGNPSEMWRDCAKVLNLTPFEMNKGLQYLLDKKLVIPSGRQDYPFGDRINRLARMAGAPKLTGMLVVNPDPPQPRREQEQKERRRQGMKSRADRQQAEAKNPSTDSPGKQAATDEDVSQEDALESPAGAVAVAEPARQAPPTEAPSLPPEKNPVRPVTNIDPTIHHYLTRALQALRADAVGTGEWLSLGVVDCDKTVANAVHDITRGQARRLVGILHKMNLVRTCEVRPGSASGGCSHVHTSPELVSAAMARKAGYQVEETVDELRAALDAARQQSGDLAARLHQKDRELTELQVMSKAVDLDAGLADRVQYFILRAMSAPLPTEEETEER